VTTLNPAFGSDWVYRAGDPPLEPHRLGLRRALLMARHRGGGRGDFVFGGPPFGFGGPFGVGGPFGGPHRGPFGRGGRARRGDIRLAILLLLAEEPRNGYTIMREIEERSGGVWRPSPGSVYPALSQLEDEELIRSSEQDGRRVFDLTEAGRAQLAERPHDAPAPWDAVGRDVPEGAIELFGRLRQVGAATMQVASAGDAAASERAAQVLDEARRSLYRILADDES
jgi:DNA-binding PadR family transcriptional regulator